MPKPCKDCGSTTRKMIDPKTGKPYPGPRCCTCHRARKAQVKEQRHDSFTANTYGEEWRGQYKALLQFQGGTCPVCKRAKGISKKLSWDHDHKCCNTRGSCGKCVRGLLCGKCNEMFGHGRDEVDFFLRAAAYLMNPPAHEFRKQKETAK